MILYLDSSAVVKRYIAEPGTAEVATLTAQAEAIGSSVLCRTEVVAALGKATHTGLLHPDDATLTRSRFDTDWPHFVRLPVNIATAESAADLAWLYSLRGFDAVHLAAALAWQGMLNAPVRFATFDRSLWRAAGSVGLDAWPAQGSI